MPEQDDADLLAARCADFMWAEDGASQAMGMQIVSVREGCAVLSMTVRETMVNVSRRNDIFSGGFGFCFRL